MTPAAASKPSPKTPASRPTLTTHPATSPPLPTLSTKPKPSTMTPSAASLPATAPTTWSGAVTGSVSRTYDTFFRISTETVNGLAATKATFGYDNDGLITSVATPAGSMALSYDPQAPRLQTTTLGQVADVRTYDQF